MVILGSGFNFLNWDCIKCSAMLEYSVAVGKI